MSGNRKKNRIIIITVICLIWLICVVSVFLYRVSSSRIGEDFTTFNSAAFGEELIYIADNNQQGGLIYMMDRSGKVLGLFSTAERSLFNGWQVSRVCYGDDTPYALISKVDKSGLRDVVKLQIVRFDEGLNATHRSPFFELSEGFRISGLSANAGKIYLTLISVNGQEACVYSIDDGQLVEIKAGIQSARDKENFEKMTLALKAVTSRVTDPGRFFTQAEYQVDTLHARDDSQTPEGLFALNDQVRAIYRARKLDFGQKLTASGVRISLYIIAAIAGVLFVILMYYLLTARRRVAYAIALFELMLAICIAGTFIFILRQEKKITKESYQRFEEYALGTLFDGISDDFKLLLGTGDIYTTREYATLQNRIADHIEASVKTVKLQDICVVNQSTGEVIISGSGRNRQDVRDLYGNRALESIRNVNDRDVTILSEGVFQGETLEFMAKYLADEKLAGYSVIGVAGYGDIFEGFAADHYGTFRLSLIVFCVCSLLGLVFFYMENYDLMRLGQGLKTLAEKGENVEKPPVFGSDMNYMWNSLFEIQKHMKMSDRIKFLTYEAYFRFAPKCIERILGKESITEVKSGDHVNLTGTLAMLSSRGINKIDSGNMDSLNGLMEYLNGELIKHDGIYMSGDSDLSLMKMLFLEDCAISCRFAVSLLEQVRQWDGPKISEVAMLLHYSSFLYGIAGTTSQAAAVLSFPEARALEDYARYLRTLHLNLVITEEVKEREGSRYDLRFIGFVNINVDSRNRRVNLYEVLDACAVYERQEKLRTRDLFEKALELYYNEDFYFARNSFTDIIKDIPDDGVAKWYLFECERCLNETMGAGFTGALRIE